MLARADSFLFTSTTPIACSHEGGDRVLLLFSPPTQGHPMFLRRICCGGFGAGRNRCERTDGPRHPPFIQAPGHTPAPAWSSRRAGVVLWARGAAPLSPAAAPSAARTCTPMYTRRGKGRGTGRRNKADPDIPKPKFGYLQANEMGKVMGTNVQRKQPRKLRVH